MAGKAYVRVVNRSDAEEMVLVHAMDNSECQPEAVRLDLSGLETAHFNSDDLERATRPRICRRASGTPLTEPHAGSTRHLINLSTAPER